MYLFPASDLIFTKHNTPRSIQVVENGKISFLRKSSIPFHIYYIIIIIFTYSSVDGYLGCFHRLATINNAVMSIGCLFLSELMFFFLQIYSKECNCWIIWKDYFQIFEEPPYCFPQRLYQCPSHRQCTSVPFSPHPCQHLLFGLFLFFSIIAILPAVK